MMVKDKWTSYSAQGNALMVIKDKLKWLKGDLKIWNRDVFGNIKTSKKMILQELEALDCQVCDGVCLESERSERIDLVSRLKETDRKMDSLLCQKARAS